MTLHVPGWTLHVKTRPTLPSWLWAALGQAALDATAADACPAVVLAEVSRGQHSRRLVVLGFDDWCALVQCAGQPAPHNDAVCADCGPEDVGEC